MRNMQWNIQINCDHYTPKPITNFRISIEYIRFCALLHIYNTIQEQSE